MRVLIWSQHFWPENFHINTVARMLMNHALDVNIVTGKPNYPHGKVFTGYESIGIQHQEYEKCAITRIPMLARGNGSSVRLALNYLSFIISGLFFGPFTLRKTKVNAVLVYATSPLLQSIPAIFIAWLKNAPLVLWVQDLWPDVLKETGHVKNKYLLSAVDCIVGFIYRRCDRILIQSESFRQSIASRNDSKNNIYYHPNSAVDLYINPHATSAITELAEEIENSFSIVFAGNIGYAQACETIVAAAQILQAHRGIMFYLIGHGSMANQIEELIKIHSLYNIRLTGQIATEDMGLIYSKASVLLLTLKDEPALSNTIPSKLQSYFAAGKPIIACSSGESAKLVNSAKAGLTCEAESAEALAQAVIAIQAKGADSLKEFGRNGREYFESNFKIDESVLHLKKHLLAAINEHGKHNA